MFRFSLRIPCEKAFSGNALQLNIVAFYSRQCAAQNEKTCRSQVQEQLQNMFSETPIIPITVRLGNKRFYSLGIKICTLEEVTGKSESTISKASYDYSLRRRERRANRDNTSDKKTEKNNDIK
jgi:hypothetical protein